MNIPYRPLALGLVALAFSAIVLERAQAGGDDYFAPVIDPVVKEECGSCHIAFAPSMLPARSWKRMMANLKDHFGDDASVDADTAARISSYLVANAADTGGKRYSSKLLRGLAPGSAPLRITELPKWVSEHREVLASVPGGRADRLFLGCLGVDVHVHDTYFVVAHFHYLMVGGTIMAYLGGLHFWWPKMTGRMYPEGWAKFAALMIFVGLNLTFFPQFLLGYMGMPRRYHVYPEEFQVLNVLSTAGATVLGFGYLFPSFYLVYSLFKGEPAGANPWGAKGLEWTTASPPPTENFHVVPVVTEEAYDYAKPPKEAVVA